MNNCNERGDDTLAKIGVIGGVGPMATAYFMEMIVKMTEAKNDQEHIEMIIYNCPTIPDRTRYILDTTNPSPLPKMIEIGKKLESEGVDIIAIPCVTASYFLDDLQREIKTPIVNIPQSVARYLQNNNIPKVGLMATDGTLQKKLFQQSLERMGIDVVLPNSEIQKDVMYIIYDNIKAGKDVEKEKFDRVIRFLKDNGAQVIILGCTELSLLKKEVDVGEGFLDAMEVLARCCVEKCGKLKKNLLL